jgi:hypothetical protein
MARGRHLEGINIVAHRQQLVDTGGICISGEAAKNEKEVGTRRRADGLGGGQETLSEPISVYPVTGLKCGKLFSKAQSPWSAVER